VKLPRFILVGLVIAALAIAMGLAVSWALTEAVADWESDNVATIVRGELDDEDVEALFRDASAPTTQERWQAILGGVVTHIPGVVRCKVWSEDGVVVWADDATLVGKHEASDDADLRAALGGRPVFRLVEPGRDDTEQAWHSQMLSRVFVPVTASAGGPVRGVIELRKLPSRLSAKVTRGLLVVWAVAVAGAAALWLVVGPTAMRRQARSGARSAPEILAEIRERFGFVPPFFEPAVGTPAVLENLWQQTLSAYVQNPVPALFKERLFAYLSRYCSVPYCIVCHSCALRPLGMTAGDVLALLEAPPRMETEITGALSVLAGAPGPVAEWPAPGSALAEAIFACAIFMFREPARAARSQAQMRRLLGDRYARLTEFLAYVKTCHAWVEAHPELAYEADQRAREHLGPLLEQEARLADFFRDYQARVLRERESAEARRLADLQAWANDLARANEALRVEIREARGGRD
jgi:hypothetical protein